MKRPDSNCRPGASPALPPRAKVGKERANPLSGIGQTSSSSSEQTTLGSEPQKKCGRKSRGSRSLLHNSWTLGGNLGITPLGQLGCRLLYSSHVVIRKIISLEYKNMQFTQIKSAYGLLMGRLMAVSLKKSHHYDDLTTVSHGLRL